MAFQPKWSKDRAHLMAQARAGAALDYTGPCFLVAGDPKSKVTLATAMAAYRDGLISFQRSTAANGDPRVRIVNRMNEERTL